MNFKKIWQGIGIAVLAFALGTATYSQPVVATIHTESVTLTAAQVKSLSTSPVELVAAPGADKMIVPLSVVYDYKFGGTPYTVTYPTDVIYINYGAGTVGTAQSAFIGLQTLLLDQTGNRIEVGMEAGVANSTSDSMFEPNTGPQSAFTGLGLYATNSDDPTGGDGTLIVTVTYEIITL